MIIVKARTKLKSVACGLILVAVSAIMNNTAIAAQTPLANAVVLIIRHAEKPDTGTGLTPKGELRATSYVKYFETFSIDSNVRAPDYLVASADTAHSQRPRLTITPLSIALHLPIDSRFKKTDVVLLVQALTTHATGKTILISWHHENIPALLTAFGVDPNALLPSGTWPDSVYDWVILLRFDANGKLIPEQSKRIGERLLPGDSD